jgi:hypothetical protein
MVRFQRTAQPKSGKFLEAIQWAAEVAEYVNTNYSQMQLQVFTEQFGAYGTIHWMFDAESLAVLDELVAPVLADQGYRAVVNKGAALIIDGSIKDTLLQLQTV